MSAQARATRLPGEFQPSAEAREYALSLGLDPDQLLKAFRDYWLAEGGQRARKLDWNAAYRFWAGREAGQRRGSRAPQRQEGLGETIDRIMRDPLGRGDDGPAPRFDFDGESEEVLNG